MDFKKYTNRTPVTKTYAYRAVPQGKTLETIATAGYIEKDKELYDAFARVKDYGTDYAAANLETCLSNAVIEPKVWEALDDAYREEENGGDSRHLESARGRALELVAKSIKSCIEPAKTLIGTAKDGEGTIVQFIRATEEDTPERREKINDVTMFIGKLGRVSDFFELRNMVFAFDSDEYKRTGKVSGFTVPRRCVVDNFEKHRINVSRFEAAASEYPEAIEQAQIELADLLGDLTLAQVFEIGAYTSYLPQSGIDFYNAVIGGWNTEDGKKVKGINEFLNEARQQAGEGAPYIALVPLWKQMLSKKESASFIATGLQSEEELKESLQGLDNIISNVLIVPTGEITSAVDAQVQALATLDVHAKEQIQIKKNDFVRLAMLVCKDKFDIVNALEACREKPIGPTSEMKTKAARQRFAKKFASLADIEAACAATGRTIKLEALTANIKELGKVEQSAHSAMLLALANLGTNRGIEAKKKDTAAIKEWLDGVNNIARFSRLFPASANEEPTDFRAIMDCAQEALAQVRRAYDGARNFLTKKPYSLDKFPVYFGREGLLKGWDVSKEKEYGNFILEKDGLYYVGIIPLGKQTAVLKQLAESVQDEQEYYVRHSFKMLKDAHMSLPHSFIASKSGRDKYHPSDELVEKYEAKKHLDRTEPCDREFLIELITYMQDCMREKDEWTVFDFTNLRAPEEYVRWIDFCADVDRATWAHWTSKVSAEVIDKLVDDGQLLLFNVWNSNFEPTAYGKKRTPTLLLMAALSFEGQDNVHMLGGGQFYYRPASIKDPIVHRKGSYVVNKTYTDAAGIVHTVPEAIHREIYLEANGRLRGQLSDKAKEYKSLVRITKLDHEIVKDRIHTEDVFELHLPFTIYPNAPRFNAIDFEIREDIAAAGGCNIIGIKRGVDTLLYATVIDKDGKILEERNLDNACGRDWGEALRIRERERDEAQAAWGAQDKIANLKDAFLQSATSEIIKLAFKYNALIAIESVDEVFSNGMGKFERTVYKRFALLLANRLACIQDPTARSEGRIGNPLQLAKPAVSYADLRSQSGILFSVNPSWTATFDPTTGFAPTVTKIFAYSSVIKARETIAALESFYFDKETGEFVYTYRASDIAKKVKLPAKLRNSMTKDDTLWHISLGGKRDRYVKNQATGKGSYEDVDVTETLEALLGSLDVDYRDGQDLRFAFNEAGKAELSELLALMALPLTMVYRTGSGDGYVMSPVASSDGSVYRTGTPGAPSCAAAHGAYCIALRARAMISSMPRDEKSGNLRISYSSNDEWLTAQVD